MKKIIFSDMDGTIIEEGKIKHKLDQEMIHHLHEKGYLFAFCTGRNEKEAKEVAHQFDYDYLVLNNGATITDKDDHILFEKKIPGEIGIKIIDEILEKYPHLYVAYYDYQETRLYFEGKTFNFVNSGYQECQFDFMNGYKSMEDFDIINCFDSHNKTDDVLEIQKMIQEKYGKYAQGTLNVIYLDITAAGCSKGTGIQALCALLDEPIETYCIGDSFNDISMFEVADHAYTFHHIKDDIKQYTDKQVDWVYEVMEDMLRG